MNMDFKVPGLLGSREPFFMRRHFKIQINMTFKSSFKEYLVGSRMMYKEFGHIAT